MSDVSVPTDRESVVGVYFLLQSTYFLLWCRPLQAKAQTRVAYACITYLTLITFRYISPLAVIYVIYFTRVLGRKELAVHRGLVVCTEYWCFITED